VQFGYGLNYLVDIANAIIVDVEPTPARTYDEVQSTKTILDRTEQHLGSKPKRLAAAARAFWCTRRVPSRCHRAEPQDLGVSSPWSTAGPAARIAFLRSVASASKSPPINRLRTNSRLISAASKLPKQHNADQRARFFNAIGHSRDFRALVGRRHNPCGFNRSVQHR
jgi:hypothetical protein